MQDRKPKIRDEHDKNLRGRTFKEGSDYSKYDFSGCNLKGATMASCFLQDANLSYIAGEGINLSNSTVSNANLSGANLVNANLSKAMLVDSDLTNVCLIRANLENANLSGAILVNIDLRNANLKGTSFLGADFFPKEDHFNHVTLKSLLDEYSHLYAEDKNYPVLKPYIFADFILKMQMMITNRNKIEEAIYCLDVAATHPFFTRNISKVSEFFSKTTDSVKEIIALLERAKEKRKEYKTGL